MALTHTFSHRPVKCAGVKGCHESSHGLRSYIRLAASIVIFRKGVIQF